MKILKEGTLIQLTKDPNSFWNATRPAVGGRNYGILLVADRYPIIKIGDIFEILSNSREDVYNIYNKNENYTIEMFKWRVKEGFKIYNNYSKIWRNLCQNIK